MSSDFTEFENLSDDDVVTHSLLNSSLPKTIRVSELKEIFRRDGEVSKRFQDSGAIGQVLKANKPGWQNGRIKLVLVFCPDQPPKTSQSEVDEFAEEFKRLQGL